MFRTTFFIAALAMPAMPALAQTTQLPEATESPGTASLCHLEASAIRDAIAASKLAEDQKGQVDDVLQQAQDQGAAGDEAGCQATVDYVKIALGITTYPQE